MTDPAQTSNADETNISPEKQQQQENEQGFQELTPEIAQGQFVAQLLLGIALIHVQKRENTREAFKTFKDPKFAEKILKVSDPAGFQRMLRDYHLVKKEVTKQQKRKKSGKIDTASIGFGPWKQTLNLDTFSRQEQAISLCNPLHTKINADNIKFKIQRTGQLYGLSNESMTSLRKGMKSWLKANPAGTINGYLREQGPQLYLKQKVGQEPNLSEKEIKKRLNNEKKQRAKELKELSKKHGDYLTAARLDAVVHNEGRITRVQQVVEEVFISDISPAQLKERQKYIQHGGVQEPVVIPTTEQFATLEDIIKETTAQPPSQQAEQQTTTQPPLQTAQQQPMNVTADNRRSQPPPTGRKPSSFKPFFSIPKISIPKLSLPPGLGKFFTKLSSIRNIGSRLVSAGFKKAAGFLGKQALIKGLGGLLSAGTLTALSAVSDVIKKFTGIDIEGVVIKFALWAAIFAVGIPVAILFLVVFGILGSSSSKSASFFPFNSQNALVVSGPNSSQPLSFNWEGFEEKYLSNNSQPVSNDVISWQQFENEYLNPHGEYITKISNIKD